MSATYTRLRRDRVRLYWDGSDNNLPCDMVAVCEIADGGLVSVGIESTSWPDAIKEFVTSWWEIHADEYAKVWFDEHEDLVDEWREESEAENMDRDRDDAEFHRNR